MFVLKEGGVRKLSTDAHSCIILQNTGLEWLMRKKFTQFALLKSQRIRFYIQTPFYAKHHIQQILHAHCFLLVELLNKIFRNII